jgi:carboxylate-amine ligase
MDATFAGTGTHPVANYDHHTLTESPRYAALLERNQWLIKRMAVYGLHVHIGMRDGDSCIRFNNFFLHFIPHMIALSASSPYWVGRDTGLAASRPTVYEAHPTSGLPIRVENWEQFNTLYGMLIQTKSIESMKDIWWDLRPSPSFGTLEIRICDGPATMWELECVVAWIHLLAHWFEDHNEKFFENRNIKPREWILRENKWRAIRFGLDATIISHQDLTLHNLKQNILFWLNEMKPYATRLGYEHYVTGIREIIERGNSSMRQRKVMEMTNSIEDVIRHNVMEFETGKPVWL